eukprot:scaffold662_cov364-Pavlova_lutheri.AAC.19
MPKGEAGGPRWRLARKRTRGCERGRSRFMCTVKCASMIMPDEETNMGRAPMVACSSFRSRSSFRVREGKNSLTPQSFSFHGA